MQPVLLREVARQGYSIRLNISGRTTQQSRKFTRVRRQNKNSFLTIQTLGLTHKGVDSIGVQHNRQRRLFHQTSNKSHSLRMSAQARSDRQHILLLEKSLHAAIVESLCGNAA